MTDKRWAGGFVRPRAFLHSAMRPYTPCDKSAAGYFPVGNTALGRTRQRRRLHLQPPTARRPSNEMAPGDTCSHTCRSDLKRVHAHISVSDAMTRTGAPHRRLNKLPNLPAQIRCECKCPQSCVSCTSSTKHLISRSAPVRNPKTAKTSQPRTLDAASRKHQTPEIFMPWAFLI